jgi:hypothetical protein
MAGILGGIGHGNIDPTTDQSSESGPYQDNATSGIPRAVQAAGTVRSQGGDLYEIGGSLILKGVEYEEKYNLGHDVPCGPKFSRCEAILINGPRSEISNIPHGIDVVSEKLTEPMGLHLRSTISMLSRGDPRTLDKLKRRRSMMRQQVVGRDTRFLMTNPVGDI